MTTMTGARYHVAIDGQPRARIADSKAIAFAAAEYLKHKNPHAEVTVHDRVTGKRSPSKMLPPGYEP
jgi:hypothetical protein